MESLEKRVQRLQDALSQCKKGEFLDLDLDLDLNLSQTLRVGPRLGLCFGLELAGPEAGLGLEQRWVGTMGCTWD